MHKVSNNVNPKQFSQNHVMCFKTCLELREVFRNIPLHKMQPLCIVDSGGYLSGGNMFYSECSNSEQFYFL
jgi:hypothetical protein